MIDRPKAEGNAPGAKRRLGAPVAFALGAAAALSAALLGRSGAIRAFDDRVQGQLLQAFSRPWNHEVLVVELDDGTLSAHGWPLPRSLQGALLAALDAAGARAVGYDIFFTEPDRSDAGGDAAFGSALAAFGHGVLVAEGNSQRSPPGAAEGELLARDAIALPPGFAGPSSRGVILPVEALARAGHLAHAQNAPGPAGTIRGIPLVASLGGRGLLALPLATYLAGAAPRPAVAAEDGTLRVGDRRIGVDASGVVIPRFRSFEDRSGRVSVAELIRSADPRSGLLSPEMAARVKGRYVLVGQTATTIGDHGPMADGVVRPLLFLHAAALMDLVEGAFPREVPGAVDFLGALLLGLLAAAAGSLWRPGAAAAALGGSVAAAWLVALGAARADWLVTPVAWTLAPLFSFGVAAVARFRVEERERRILRSAFGAYVAPELLDRIVRDPWRYLSPGGTRKRLSILFSDIQGYTRLSNTLPPEAVLAILREYLEAMTRIIFRHDGRVDKIMGDGILAFFGDLVPMEDHARRAVRAASEMQREVARLTREWNEAGKAGIVIRIGIATGEVFIGNIGSKDHLEYTVLGPTVNLAARLEGKAPPAGVLCSAETYEETRDEFEYRKVEGLSLKGFGDAYDAWLCVGAREARADERRRFHRLDTAAPVLVDLGGAQAPGAVENVSAGGLFVRCALAAEEGAPVAIAFPAAPGAALGGVAVEGTVRHRREEGGFGVALARAESERPEALREFVSLFFGIRPEARAGELEGDDGARFSYELSDAYGRLLRHS